MSKTISMGVVAGIAREKQGYRGGEDGKKDLGRRKMRKEYLKQDMMS